MFWPRKHSRKKQVKVFNSHQERLPCLFGDFLKKETIVSRRRPYFTPVRAKVTISFEKLTNKPS